MSHKNSVVVLLFSCFLAFLITGTQSTTVVSGSTSSLMSSQSSDSSMAGGGTTVLSSQPTATTFIPAVSFTTQPAIASSTLAVTSPTTSPAAVGDSSSVSQATPVSPISQATPVSQAIVPSQTSPTSNTASPDGGGATGSMVSSSSSATPTLSSQDPTSSISSSSSSPSESSTSSDASSIMPSTTVNTPAATASVTSPAPPAPTTSTPSISTKYPTEMLNKYSARYTLELEVNNGKPITMTCNSSHTKDLINREFQKTTGFLEVVEEGGDKFILYFSASQLNSQTNDPQNATAMAVKGALTRLNATNCLEVDFNAMDNNINKFAAQTADICQAHGICSRGFYCVNNGQEVRCLYMCERVDCGQHGECKLMVTKEGQTTTKCDCKDVGNYRYSGDKCQSSHMKPETVVAIVGGVLGAVCFILIIIIIVMCARRGQMGGSKYEMNGHFNDAYDPKI